MKRMGATSPAPRLTRPFAEATRIRHAVWRTSRTPLPGKAATQLNRGRSVSIPLGEESHSTLRDWGENADSFRRAARRLLAKAGVDHVLATASKPKTCRLVDCMRSFPRLYEPNSSLARRYNSAWICSSDFPSFRGAHTPPMIPLATRNPVKIHAKVVNPVAVRIGTKKLQNPKPIRTTAKEIP